MLCAWVRGWQAYYVSAIQAAFDATPLSCKNAAILVMGPADSSAARSLQSAFDCVHSFDRKVPEEYGQPTMDEHAADDYSTSARSPRSQLPAK